MKKSPELDELKKIAQEHGGILMPEHVVDAAKPVNSILHSKFEWDDTTAAQRYRLWQARQLITIMVEYVKTDKDNTPYQVFVSLKSDRQEGGYRTITSVMSDEQLKNQLLADALEDMEIFQNKYQILKELSIVFAAMKKVKKRKKKIR